MSYLMLPTEALHTPGESGPDRHHTDVDRDHARVVAWAALVLVAALAGAAALFG